MSTEKNHFVSEWSAFWTLEDINRNSFRVTVTLFFQVLSAIIQFYFSLLVLQMFLNYKYPFTRIRLKHQYLLKSLK